jgi:hypothetical protein
MSGLTLFQLAGEYREAADKLESLDIDEATFVDTLESLGGDLETKAKNTAFVARNLEASADQIDAAIAEMAKRSSTIKKNAERVRNYLMDGMIFAGVKKLETPYFVISIRDNPPKVCVDDEKQIPSEYFTDPPPPAPKLDKKLVAQAIKDGHTVPGAHIERGTSLQIK